MCVCVVYAVPLLPLSFFLCLSLSPISTRDSSVLPVSLASLCSLCLLQKICFIFARNRLKCSSFPTVVSFCPAVIATGLINDSVFVCECRSVAECV